MVQLSQPVEQFGEVNVHRGATGGLDIIAKVLMVPDIEGARTGLAIDGSASMTSLYGENTGPFGGGNNVVEPVARQMTAFLCNFSADGRTSLLYWAVAPDGSATEEIGRFTAAEVATVKINGPKKMPWGRGTKLLPPVRYFVESAFDGAPWGIAVFVTDGKIDDLQDVKSYCLGFGQQIAAGQRAPCKFVLIGLGKHVDESQMEELDDMFEGSGLKTPSGDEVDIWDHKLAAEMRKLEDIFAEVVSENAIVIPSGRVLDQQGRVAKEYNDGVPALLRFTLERDATCFILEYPGGSVTQDISEVLTRI